MSVPEVWPGIHSLHVSSEWTCKVKSKRRFAVSRHLQALIDAILSVDLKLLLSGMESDEVCLTGERRQER